MSETKTKSVRKKRRKQGRPKINLTDVQIKQIDTMAAIGLTLDHIAAIIQVSPRTLDRLIAADRDKCGGDPRRAKPGNIFGILSQARAKGDVNIAQTAYAMATNGQNPGMTIFMCKVRLGWKETVKLEHSGSIPAEIKSLSDDELDQKIAETISRLQTT